MGRGSGRRAGADFGAFSRGFGSTSSTLRFKITPEPEKPPRGGLVPISPAAITPQTWRFEISRDIAFPRRPAHAGSPNFHSKQRGEPPPKCREKTEGKPPPASSPRSVSRHVFKFVFSKALSAPGAEGARGGGSTAPAPPAAASQDSTVQTTLPPPRPVPTDVEKYKNPKKLLQ